MSRLSQFIPKKQFRCLPVSGSQSFRYVEIITSAEQSNNYQQKTSFVDRNSLSDSWAEFYFLSTGRGSEQ